jgi:hypothetical protein
MSHLPVWKQRGQTYAQYQVTQAAVLDRAYRLTQEGLGTHDAVSRARSELDTKQ